MRAVLIAFALVVIAMMTNQSYRDRQIDRANSEIVEGLDRFVDVGVTLHTVTDKPIPGGKTIDVNGRTLWIIRSKLKGGILDTKATPPTIVDSSRDPVVWCCSEDQEVALLHKSSTTPAQLVYGSEGAGKTRLLAMWHYFRWLDHLGEYREGGQTAPTLGRLGLVKAEMLKVFRPDWARYAARDDFEGFEMCDGTRIRFRYAHQQSAAKGAPIQGYNWSWCGRDEMQDQVQAHEDIESRGRSAKDGIYPQLATATAKDDTAWRELRDVLLGSTEWVKRSLSIFRSPFVDPRFLQAKKQTVTPREFLRRYGDPITGEVSDLPPELAVYYGWLRNRNLVALPRIVTDVTPALLTGYQSYVRPGARFTMIAAHDPGNIYNTTVILRLLMFGDTPTWAVVGELQTEQTTAREHAIRLRDYLQRSFYIDLSPTRDNPNPSSKCLVFCDPHGKGAAQTDYQSVYMAMQKEGLDVFSPAAMSGRIKRSARVEMMNRLLGGSADNAGTPRLVVCTDDQRRPLAPKIVEAFESLKKKPGDDDPEGSQTKDAGDKTHAPAACSYGLWMFEQEAFTEQTIKTALAEARSRR